MLVGYARTSTLEQMHGLEAQRESLKAAGCDRVYDEQVSSVGSREALSAAMSFCREGDVLVVAKLDRLARSVRHLGQIIEDLSDSRVGLRVLDLGLDTTTATGKLMLNVLGCVAQFEREMMLERQKEGIQRAKSEGKYKGRHPSAKLKKDLITELAKKGKTKREISKDLNISERSVYRILQSTVL